MPKVKLEAELSKENLLKAVQQLSISELEEFMQNIIAFRAQKLAPNLSKRESELLLKINDTLDKDIQRRYQLLINKREDESLTENEYQELLALTDEVEKYQAQRLKYLAELSILQGCSLSKLINKLGIIPTANEAI